jgi:hypothetical protein
MARAQKATGLELQYICRCSFLQIHNEQITDLLQPGSRPLALRYDTVRGAYAENLSQHVVNNGELTAPMYHVANNARAACCEHWCLDRL